jgi:hypothetical protein
MTIFWIAASLYWIVSMPICAWKAFTGHDFLEEGWIQTAFTLPIWLCHFGWDFGSSGSALFISTVTTMTSMGLLQGVYAEPIPVNHYDRLVDKALAYGRLAVLALIHTGLALLLVCSGHQTMTKEDGFKRLLWYVERWERGCECTDGQHSEGALWAQSRHREHSCD